MPPAPTPPHTPTASPALPSPAVRLPEGPRLQAPDPDPNFVGRRSLLGALYRALKKQDGRLVSLWGGPGVGKTAIATVLYHRTQELFPGGRYWLDLRGGDAAAALRALLALLGVDPQAMPPTLEGLCHAAHHLLQGKKVLLVLDNAETLAADDPARVRHLVTRMKLPAPGVTLVTSRVSIIPTGDEHRVEVLDEADALALLRAHLHWDDAAAAREAADARKVIERLGGLALALDLTARHMMEGGPPPQRCAEALRALESAPRLVHALHLRPTDGAGRAAADAFALSYDPLPAPARAAFHALGICHPSGASVDALADLLDMPEEAARGVLTTLVNRSLATWVGERARARLHPLLHDFAAQRAEADPATHRTLLLRHARHLATKSAGHANAQSRRIKARRRTRRWPAPMPRRTTCGSPRRAPWPMASPTPASPSR